MINYKENFQESLNNIEKLISAPFVVKDFVLDILSGIDFSSLKNTEKNKYDNGIKVINNISDKSLSDSYRVIYNQSCVLVISSSCALIEEYFKNFVNDNWEKMDLQNNKEIESIKLNLKEMAEFNFEITGSLGSIILDKVSSINFQDLQSIKRTIKNYLNKEVNIKDDISNNIIFYQQCRHILVHRSGIIDEEFIKKTGVANKKNYKSGEKIQLDEKDWDSIKESFLILIEAVIKN